jgi:Domain of unknown function (DUF4145)
MKCPHCRTGINLTQTEAKVGASGNLAWFTYFGVCPECKEPVIYLRGVDIRTNIPSVQRLIHPKATSRTPVAPEVPAELAEDYREACLVFEDSAKASAALSRRCLQILLRTAAGVRPQDLSKEIDEVLPKLPSDLATAIDAVRHVGNFATHPIKSTHTGEIVPVEPQEAEWLLDVLEELFEFYFVRPAAIKARRDALNKKLADAGKPPLK